MLRPSPCTILRFVLFCLCGPAQATGGSAPAVLADSDRRILEHGLGTDVVGPAVPAPPLADPTALLAPEFTQRSFRLLVPGRPAQAETHRISPREGLEGPAWRYRVAEQEAEVFLQEPDGDVSIVGVNDFKEKVATRYSPPKPTLFKGMQPGEERKTLVDVRVSDLEQPDRLLHTGALDVVIAYLGAFRIKLPAGESEALLLRSSAHGRIGPARIDDVQYQFFVPGKGAVATVQQREVKAFGIYHSTLQEARVLAANPVSAGAP